MHSREHRSNAVRRLGIEPRLHHWLTFTLGQIRPYALSQSDSNCLPCLSAAVVWRPTWELAGNLGYELGAEIREGFKPWEVSESRQGCAGKSFSLASRTPSDTSFKGSSAWPNGNQSKKLKTGSLWNCSWLWEEKTTWYFPFGKRLLASSYGVSVSERCLNTLCEICW